MTAVPRPRRPDGAIRIGGASAFWGDTQAAAGQLVRGGDIDYLVFDYLAEITLSLLARIKRRKPEAGFVPDFIEAVAPCLPEIVAQGIKVVSNGGGMNPEAAAAALRARAEAVGLTLRIAVVTGDDLLPRLDELRAAGLREMFTGAALPGALASANAYLGARPIVLALEAGADVVITGRCVDSAVTLAPLVHAFGWSWDDHDRLAMGSLAGHLIECGAQVTGGLFTDWRDVPGWEDMGFPVAECRPDGGFAITKPPGTGGLVTPLTVAEQLVYEIGDPASYVLPDVVCDFRDVALRQAGPDRVEVLGARGRAPTGSLKVSATVPDGFRSISTFTVGGPEAGAKARRAGEAVLARVARLLAEAGLPPLIETSVEVLGSEATYGPHARPGPAASREVVLKLAARHPSEAGLAIFAREIAPAGTATAQGFSGFFAGRPGIQPVLRGFSFLWPAADVPVRVTLDGVEVSTGFGAQPSPLPGGSSWAQPDRGRGPSELALGVDAGGGTPTPDPSPEGGGERDRSMGATTATVPLLRLAVARSGDKGDTANIGIIARKPAYLPAIRAALTRQAVQAYFAHTGTTRVERFELPGLHAFNFLLHEALGGGGVASLRIDPQGKAFAQMLLDMPVPVPAGLLDR